MIGSLVSLINWMMTMAPDMTGLRGAEITAIWDISMGPKLPLMISGTGLLKKTGKEGKTMSTNETVDEKLKEASKILKGAGIEDFIICARTPMENSTSMVRNGDELNVLRAALVGAIHQIDEYFDGPGGEKIKVLYLVPLKHLVNEINKYIESKEAGQRVN